VKGTGTSMSQYGKKVHVSCELHYFVQLIHLGRFWLFHWNLYECIVWISM